MHLMKNMYNEQFVDLWLGDYYDKGEYFDKSFFSDIFVFYFSQIFIYFISDTN